MEDLMILTRNCNNLKMEGSKECWNRVVDGFGFRGALYPPILEGLVVSAVVSCLEEDTIVGIDDWSWGSKKWWKRVISSNIGGICWSVAAWTQYFHARGNKPKNIIVTLPDCGNRNLITSGSEIRKEVKWRIARMGSRRGRVKKKVSLPSEYKECG